MTDGFLAVISRDTGNEMDDPIFFRVKCANHPDRDAVDECLAEAFVFYNRDLCDECLRKLILENSAMIVADEDSESAE